MAIKRSKVSDETKQKQMQEIHEKLADQVELLRDSGRWEQFLKFSSAFHKYSFNNMMLIQSQLSTASSVTGFRKWQELGRQVRKGEKAIKIFGFSERRTKQENENSVEAVDKDDSEPQVTRYYPILSVFDISQTDPGPDWVDPNIAELLTGDKDLGLIEAATTNLEKMGWSVEFTKIGGEVNGYAMFDGSKRVVVEETLSPAAKAKTLLHETGHVLMHSDLPAGDYERNRGLREVEAESVAYMSANSLGLDSAAYSVGYVTGWAEGDIEMIRETAQKVITVSRKLVEDLEPILEQQESIKSEMQVSQDHSQTVSDKAIFEVNLPTITYAEVSTILNNLPKSTVIEIDINEGEATVPVDEALQIWEDISPGEGFSILSIGADKHKKLGVTLAQENDKASRIKFVLADAEMLKRTILLEDYGYIKPIESTLIFNAWQGEGTSAEKAERILALPIHDGAKKYLHSVAAENAGTGKRKSWSETLPISSLKGETKNKVTYKALPAAPQAAVIKY